MFKQRKLITGGVGLGVAVAIATVHAQVGRGTTEWLTAGADAQRTSHEPAQRPP